MKLIRNTFLIISFFSVSFISYKGTVHAEGFYCNIPGAPCETLNVNDCRAMYYDWMMTGACTVSFLDIESCAAGTSCTY